MKISALVLALVALGMSPAAAWPWDHNWYIVTGDNGRRVVAGPYKSQEACNHAMRERRDGRFVRCVQRQR